MSRKVSTQLLDRRFSLLVRTLSGWICQRCKKQYAPNSQGLHASHFYGRRNKSTRYDLENVVAHCFKCHQHLTANPWEHTAWKIEQLGKERFRQLQDRANMPVKFNNSFRLEVLGWVEEMLRKVEAA